MAANAGAKVRLNVRGMYSLLPKGLEHPENLEAMGIIDRYLEHTRIFVFANGGERKVFLSSGDWMTRNLDRRVEVAFPIYESSIQQQLIDFMDVQWRDNVKARVLGEVLGNRYRPRVGKAVRAQAAFYERLRGPAGGESENKASA